jgi:formate hydrogenlyase subunit 6/NADH:ubiquinone oxidoreductase subunit I
MLPTITINNETCLGPLDCGECMRICPMTIFIAGPTKKWKFRETDSQDYKVYARYYDQCVTCFKCVEVCPEECIAVTVDAGNGDVSEDDEDE